MTRPARFATWPAAARLAGTLLALAALSAQAQVQDASYPDRPLRAVQGFAVGGNADTIARVVGAEMSKQLGQPIVVEAQPGAGGTLAAATVARARPDGYTLLMATGGHAVAGALYEKLPYRTLESFQMVSTVTYFPFLIVTRADSPLTSIDALFAAARKAGAALPYGTAGTGTTHHLAGELLAGTAGLDLLHIPYRGDAASVTALLGGEVNFIIAPPTAVEAHVRAGTLRALAVTGEQRWAGMPEVPTVAEHGVPGYDVRSWAGWMVPAGTPAEVLDRLAQATRAAVAVPEVRARLAQMGGEAQASTPAEMTDLVQRELHKWNQVVEQAGIARL